MENIQQDLGVAIKTARTRAKLSQTELAELSGMKKQDISAIENGKRNVSLDLIQRLASALGMEAEVVLK